MMLVPGRVVTVAASPDSEDAVGKGSAHVDRAATVEHGRIAAEAPRGSEQASDTDWAANASVPTTVPLIFPAATILASASTKLPKPHASLAHAWMRVEFAPPVAVMPGPS